jgi:hypothetical protein
MTLLANNAGIGMLIAGQQLETGIAITAIILIEWHRQMTYLSLPGPLLFSRQPRIEMLSWQKFCCKDKTAMELRFLELRRLIELWAAWYSIGVDGWLATDESTHSCTLELPNPITSNGSGSRPPYPPDPELDRLMLRALNRFGLQCHRRGALSLSHSGTGEEITRIGEPLIAMLELEHRFFTGKHLYLYSELRRDYGDFGSHIMALELSVQERRAIVRRASFDVNNQRRGLKLNLWDTIRQALTAYEEIYEQGAALGHSLAGGIPELDESELLETFSPPEDIASETETPAQSSATDNGTNNEVPDATQPDGENESGEPERYRVQPVGFPFPCQSEGEASHLARLSNLVAPSRRAAAEGAILTSTHSLRELAALITFARFCEPAGVMQRS